MKHPTHSFTGVPARKMIALTVLGLGTALVLAGCSAPGATSSTTGSSAASTNLGSKKQTIHIMVDTAAVTPLTAMGKDFTKKYPNVTVKVTGEDFNTLITDAPRILASGTVPDLIRLGSYGNLIKDNLVASLDPYAKAYGWDKWPQSQFASLRSNKVGTERGTGSLYGAGPGYGLTGIFYNKSILTKLGLTAPATLADFESDMAKAKAAGYTALEIDGKDGGLSYPIENLTLDYSKNSDAVQAWNYTQKGASINTAETVKAATTLQSWANSGYINSDTLSTDGGTATTEFSAGKTLFDSTGNWNAPGLDKALSGDVGFMVFPSVTASGTKYAMSASEVLAIPEKSTHKDAAAAFLNFMQTNAAARQITVDDFGLAPAGPSDASTPTAAGAATEDTIKQFAVSVAGNGLVEFMANATASMSVNTLIPQGQLLYANKTTPAAFAAKLQSDYLADVAG